MVKIRLMRMGAKKTPHYRVVVVDSRKKRSRNYIESLGYYDPRDTTDTPLKIDIERALSTSFMYIRARSWFGFVFSTASRQRCASS